MKNTKKRVLSVVALLVMLALVTVVAVKQKDAVIEGQKDITVTIESERDNFEKTVEVSTECETLGEWVREFEGSTWEESTYGLYIQGFYGYQEDIDNQYWWCVYVGEESSTEGVDYIELQDNGVYKFSLVQGW